MDEGQLIQFLERNGKTKDDEDYDYFDPDNSERYFKRLKERICEEGTHHMVSNYAAFLKVIKECENYESRVVEKALSTLFECTPTLVKELQVKGGIKKLNDEDRKLMICSLGTLFFLMYRCFVEFENKITKESSNATYVTETIDLTKRGRKRKAEELVAVTRSQFEFWNLQWRKKILEQMCKLVKLPIYELHRDRESPDYVKCSTMTCILLVRTLPNIILKDNSFCEAITTILGTTLASKYDEDQNMLGRLIQLLKTEECSKIIAQIFNSLEEEYEIEGIIQKAIRVTLEAHRNQLKEAQNKKSNFSSDKGMSTFLTELVSLNMPKMEQCLPFLFHFLGSDSSTMRMAILIIFGDFILNTEIHVDEMDEKMLKQRRHILDKICERLRDQNSFIQNRVLQNILKMVSSDKIRLDEIIRFVDAISYRVLDKNPTTRKNSIALVREIINKYPMVIKFRVSDFNDKIRDMRRDMRIDVLKIMTRELKMEYHKIKITVEEYFKTTKTEFYKLGIGEMPENQIECNKIIEKYLLNKDYWNACEAYYGTFKKLLNDPENAPNFKNLCSESLCLQYFRTTLGITEFGEEDEADEFELAADPVESDELKKTRELILYFSNYLKLCQLINEIHEKLNRLMRIGEDSDKSEVLSFYATIGLSGYKPSDEVVIKILDTMSCIDKKTCDWSALTDIFEKIFFSEVAEDDLGMAKSLIRIINILPYNRRIEMSGIIDELNQRGKMTSLVNYLWDAFCLKTPTWTNENSKSSIFLIGILCKYNESIIKSNIKLMIDIGFGERAENDFQLAVSTIEALNCILYKVADGENVLKKIPSYLTFPSDHEIFQRFTVLVLKGVNEADDQPLENYGHMIFKMMHFIYTIIGNPKPFTLSITTKVRWCCFDPASGSKIKGSELCFQRYFVILNSMISAHVFYYETIVIPEIRRRKGLVHEHEQKQDEEFALMSGQTGTDFEEDAIRHYIENLMSKDLLNDFSTRVFEFCGSFHNLKLDNFKMTIIHCLSNIVLVGATATSHFIEAFLKLWRIVGIEHKIEMIRAAKILAARYPNQMEPINKLILQEFRQPDETIRKSALEYMSFLALGEYVKVREQLTEISLCTVDESPSIRESARDFIKKTADKEIMLNNALPDIISRLSQREDVSQLKYQEVMKFLLSVAKKERLIVGGLIEKLVIRFKLAKTTREYQDLAYCLSHMNYNEKSYKILRDNFKCYSDKLADPKVSECFEIIMTCLKKNSKEDYTQRIEELDRDIVAAIKKCSEKDRIIQKTKEKNKGVLGAADGESSGSDVEMDENEQENAKNNGNNSRMSRLSIGISEKRRSKIKAARADDSDSSSGESISASEDSDSQEQDKLAPKGKSKGKSTTTNTRESRNAANTTTTSTRNTTSRNTAAKIAPVPVQKGKAPIKGKGKPSNLVETEKMFDSDSDENEEKSEESDQESDSEQQQAPQKGKSKGKSTNVAANTTTTSTRTSGRNAANTTTTSTRAGRNTAGSKKAPVSIQKGKRSVKKEKSESEDQDMSQSDNEESAEDSDSEPEPEKLPQKGRRKSTASATTKTGRGRTAPAKKAPLKEKSSSEEGMFDSDNEDDEEEESAESESEEESEEEDQDKNRSKGKSSSKKGKKVVESSSEVDDDESSESEEEDQDKNRSKGKSSSKKGKKVVESSSEVDDDESSESEEEDQNKNRSKGKSSSKKGKKVVESSSEVDDDESSESEEEDQDKNRSKGKSSSKKGKKVVESSSEVDDDDEDE